VNCTSWEGWQAKSWTPQSIEQAGKGGKRKVERLTALTPSAPPLRFNWATNVFCKSTLAGVRSGSQLRDAHTSADPLPSLFEPQWGSNSPDATLAQLDHYTMAPNSQFPKPKDCFLICSSRIVEVKGFQDSFGGVFARSFEELFTIQDACRSSTRRPEDYRSGASGVLI